MASSARIDELRKKFEENPRRYFAPLANEYRKAGDIEQAISICREYLPQQPGHMSGHIVYGQALYEARQYEEARTVFETALALDPENLIALRHLGDIALIVGDIENARTWYGRVLEADPRNEEIQGQLRSLDTVTSSEPTPMSAPAVLPIQAADAAPPVEPPAVPLSSVPTVVVAAVPMPAIEHTVELPMTAVPSAAPESLSTTPTAEITVDGLPVPAVPDLEKLTPADAPSTELPVEKASGFEATAPASASEEPPVTRAAGLETTAAAPTEVPPLDSFTLEGLEITSMGSAPAEAPAPPPPGEPAHVPASEPAAVAASEPAPVPDLELAMPPSEPVADSEAALAETPPEGPALSSELPFLDVGEATAEAKPEAVATHESPVPAEPPMAESKPFVTETMAELYEQQGHREEALRVYRALREQRPNDDHIRARIEQLERKRGPTIREMLSRVAARRPQVSAAPPPASTDGAGTAAVAESQIASAALPTSEPVSIAPAATESPARPERVPEPPAVARSARGDLLGQLFGSPNVSGADETAAVTLAAAFSNDRRDNGSGSLAGAPARPASKDLSLDAVFGAEGAPPPASSFSFDQFFSQRATAEQPVPGKPGSEGGGAGQETKDDVAKFTQWLEGLKQR